MDDKKTAREIFNKVINFESCLRTLNWEFGYWAGVIERWQREGLPSLRPIPQDVNFADDVLGPALPVSAPSYGDPVFIDYDVSRFFDFDEGFAKVPYDYWIFPAFERKVIFEDERLIELYDYDGIRKIKMKDGSSMPFWLEYPVKNKSNWEKIKEERFNPDSISKRYFGEAEKFIKQSKNRTCPMAMLGGRVGFFGSVRFLIGEKDLYFAYYDKPQLLKDICGYLCDFWINIAEELMLKMDFDAAVFWEDINTLLLICRRNNEISADDTGTGRIPG